MARHHKAFLTAVCSAVLVATACRGVTKPLAFTGDGGLRAFQMDVTLNNRIRVVDCTKEWLKPSEYGKYAAVMIEGGLSKIRTETTLWKEPEDLAAVKSYVEGGGVILVAGWALQRLTDGNPEAAKLFGVRNVHGGAGAAVCVRLAGKDKPLLWGVAQSCAVPPGKLMPGAEALAEAEFKNGSKAVVATRNVVGKGAVYWCSATCAMIDMRFSAMKKSLGEADEKGVFVPTPEGEAVTALRRFYADILLSVPDLDKSAPLCDWGDKPLGAPGGIDTNGTFAVRPVWGRMPEYKPGIAFIGNGAKGVVVAPSGEGVSQRLSFAEEIAWHFERMCGEKPAVSKTLPADESTPAIVICDTDAANSLGMRVGARPYGSSVIRRFGNRLYVGGTGAGISYSVTYLLEALGCRYLWPGKLGKVIPKRDAVVLPEIDFVYTPKFKFRKIRQFPVAYHHDKEDLKASWGIEQAEYEPLFRDGRFDRKGNREYFKWHGLNDENDLAGSWRWGHYFGDYWQKYGKEHPDWFALQPNGSRDQELGARSERPTLCLSNPGLIEQTAKDAIAAFKGNKQLRSFSICLPDGGPTTQCMCSKCRALDPVNAAPNPFYIGAPWWRTRPYVALSDRVMHFNNAIAERVVKECPNAKLGVYVYSMYEKPTVTLRPHPALVMLTVAGSYATRAGRDYALANLAYWSRYDNMLLWRPNVFFSYSMAMPQNYARKLVEDMELFKLNHVIGTDFDCMNEQFAVKGLIWYMAAKAHRNPHSLPYDTLLDDYCRAGFGAGAADVRAYFDALEAMCNKAVVLVEGSASSLDGNAAYVQTFDPDALERHLAAAEAKAAGDPDPLARIAYLRIGLAAGRIEKRLGEAWAAKSKEGVIAAQNELKELVRDTSINKDPFALCPVWATGTYHSPHMRKPNF